MKPAQNESGLHLDQLLQAQIRAEAAERWARSVTETAADSVVIIDDKGLIHSFNSAAERTFGYRSAEVIGRNVSMLMPEPYRSQHDHYLGRFLATGEKRIIGVGREVTAITRDGREFAAFLSISGFEHEGRTFFTGILRDISELKAKEQALCQANQALSRQNRLQSFQLSLTHQLRGCHDPETFGKNLLIALAIECGALGGLLYVQEDGALRAIAGHGYEPGQAPVLAPGQGLVGRAVREKRFLVLENLTGFELHTGLGKLVPDCLAVLPLVREEVASGALILSFLSPSQEVIGLLEGVARHVSFHFSTMLDGLLIRELLEANERRSALAEQRRMLEEML
ncbi:MAG: PAS domain S-box protein, partial [Candidatus Eremiobacteraeota bacterium]|nr:PAS domain S-box protein [Candidatus Eremiobacteraeota bacterium]